MDGYFRRLNPQWEKALGFSLADLEGKRFLEFVHPDDVESTRATMLKLSRREEILSFENRYRCKDGSYRWIEWRSLPQGNLIYAAARDITDRKRAEDVMKQAKEQAEAANRAKSEFLANISHDLRTPLNAILGFSSMLESATLDDKQKKFIDIIQNKSSTLLSLIGDILEVSRLESGKIALKSVDVDLAAIVADAVEVARYELRSKNVRLLSFVDEKIPRLTGDLIRISQVVANLLSNAVKYTNEGEIRMTVTCETDTPAPGRCLVRISVKDTGLGIPPERMRDIFEPFIRLHEFEEDRTNPGTGLGLHIVKTLADLMGGGVSVSSEAGRGSEFVVTLDLLTRV